MLRFYPTAVDPSFDFVWVYLAVNNLVDSGLYLKKNFLVQKYSVVSDVVRLNSVLLPGNELTLTEPFEAVLQFVKDVV